MVRTKLSKSSLEHLRTGQLANKSGLRKTSLIAARFEILWKLIRVSYSVDHEHDRKNRGERWKAR